MASITQRGSTFRIMVSLGYGMDGRQIRKTTTYTPPEGVTPGKARKLAEAYAHGFEKHCQGVTNLNENIRFHELASWYFQERRISKCLLALRGGLLPFQRSVSSACDCP